MAQLAVTAGGAAAGYVAGMPWGPGGAILGAQLGALAGSIIGGIFFPGGSTTPGPVVGDLKVQAASYGKPMPLLAGTSRVAGEVNGLSELVATPVTSSVGGGLGFGTPQQGVAQYTYSVTMAVSFGIPLLGPAFGITRIWADGKKIHDTRPNGSHASLRGATLRKYFGSSTQLPDKWIQSRYGAAVASAYRGQVYIVLENLQLSDFANHPPNITAEVVCAGTDAYPYQLIGLDTGTNFEQLLTINSDLGIIVKCDYFGNLTVVDTQTGDVIAGPSDVLFSGDIGGMNVVFGVDGYLYASRDASTGGGNAYSKWSKVDPNSLQVVGSVGFNGVFDDSNHDGLPLAGLKCRDYPYLLGTESFSQDAVIVSTGQIEALLNGTPTGGNLPMRFVGKTENSVGDPLCQDWEIDALSLSNALAADTAPPIQYDLWGVWGDLASTTCKLYHMQVTDNLIPGGGSIAGGANGVNPITLIETIDISGAWTVDGGALLTYTDDGEHALIILRGVNVVKFNLDSKTVTGAQLSIADAGQGISFAALRQGTVDGLLYCGNSSNLNVLDVVNWVIDETIDLSNFVSGLTVSNPQYDELDGTLWVQMDGSMYELTLDVVDSTGVVLGDVVNALCQLGGLTAAQLDTSLLTQTIYGYAVPRQCSIRDALKPLADAFLFEVYEADFKLKFAPLGSSTVEAALILDDIGAYAESATRPEPLTITDTNQRQLPRRVTVKYINPDPTYQNGLQAAQRHQALVTTVSELALDVPIVMFNDDAANVAEAWLERSWVNARQFEFAISSKFLGITPTDIITVTDQYGNTYQMIIKKIDAGADGTFKVTAVLEDPESYVPAAPFNGAAQGQSNPGENQPSQIGHTDAELMDIVLISDAQDGQGFYLAMAPNTGNPSSWLGGVLMVSTDGGNSFTAEETITTPANIGRATTALPAPPGGRWTTWDRVNSVTVRLFNPANAPSSTSECNVLNGANLAVLGNELIAFATVTANSDGTCTLSDLLRGLRGSDPFIGTHVIGDRFVMVDFTTWSDILPDPNFASTRVYKTQSIGASTIPAMSQLFTDTGQRLMPLTAQGPEMAASGSDLVITWNRRSRIGGENEWLDGIATTPLGEETESYQVDILKSGTPVRTYSSTSPTVTYLAADQVTDFGSDQTEVEVVIYQMSATVGRGFGLDAMLSLP